MPVATRSASRSGTPAASSRSSRNTAMGPPPTPSPTTPYHSNTRSSPSSSPPSTAVLSRATKTSSSPASTFTHTPPRLILIWLAVSLPLVAWDTAYVLGRPHTMPGGSMHRPLWTPYDLYGRVDHVYGFRAWDARNGFTGAQGAMNLVETAMYLFYLGCWYLRGELGGPVRGKGSGRGRKSRAEMERGRVRGVNGRLGAIVMVMGFAAAVMTFSKTVLYWLNEYYSAFDNIGHNDVRSLIFLWIIPNGAWLVLPAYMIYHLGSEIIDGLAAEHIKRA